MSVHRQTLLRSIQLLGPALQNATSSTNASAPSLWRLVVDGNYAGPGARPAESRNVGVRVLLQDAQPRPLHPENSWAAPPHEATPVDFHVPRLLQLRVRQRGGPRLGIAASADLAIQSDLTASELLAVPDYRDPLAGDWPRAAARNAAGKAEIVLPALRLANGRIRVALAKDIRDVSLGLNETVYRLFADADGDGLRVLADNGLFMLDLVADGIEFDAELPNPLSTSPATLPRARVRLFHGRHPLSGEPRYGLALIGAPEEELSNLRDALAQIDRESERISAAPGDPNRAPLRLRPNPYQRVVPLCWWLDRDLRFRYDRDSVTASIGGELLRPLLQTRVATSSLPLPAEFHALAVSVTRTGSQRTLQLDTHVDDDAGRRELEALKLTWRTAPETALPAFAATLRRADGAPFPLSLDLALERERLTTLYANAGVLPAGRPAPYAFIPVSRGLLQLPLLPPPESPDEVPPSPPARRLARDAFNGLIAADITTVADTASVPAQAIEASGAAALVARLSLDGARLLTTEVELRGPRARLSGLFWCIEASPRPEEILPVLDGGPAALRTLDLHVGRDDERGPGFAAQHWSSAAAWTLQLSSGKDATAHAWLRHTSLPLIAAASMTRTAAAAAQPSRSRHLVPTALDYGPAKAPIRLTYQPGQLRPQLAGGTGAATHWPWPDHGVTHAAAMNTQPPSVALLPLHVPGVVAVPADPTNWTSTTALHAALRFDLPLLDELHAGSVLPRTEPLAAAFGPVVAPATVANGTTALDLTTLAERWRDTAERLSLAATQIAHATGWTPPIPTATVNSANAGTLVSVTGLVEPFTFETRFGLFDHDSLNGTRLPFGSYVFAGEHAAGERALRGWKADLVIRDGELHFADPATADNATAEHVRIIGFAAQARQDPINGEVTDSRGTTLAAQARTLDGVAGALVLRAQRRHFRRDASGAVDTIADELATLQQPLPLRFGADGATAAQLWFRDLPLRELAFDAGHSVLETAAGPGDGALQGSNIAANAYEWRCFGNDEQFDIALGALRFRPLRLANLVLGRDGDDWRPLSARLIGRLQLPLTPAVDAPFGRDHEYVSGNLVALELIGDGDGLRLTQVQRLQLATAADATLPWQASTEPLRFQLGADLVYVNGASVATTDTRIPVELELTLAPALENGAPAFDAATLRLRLFGSDLALSGSATPAAPVSEIATLVFAPPPTTAAAGAQIALDKVTLRPRDTDWMLQLDATLQLDLTGHRGTLLPLLRWPLAQQPQWLGLNFAAPDNQVFVAQIDHADGMLTATSAGLLPVSGDWLGVLPLTEARAGGALAFVFDGKPELRAASAFVELQLRSELLELRQQIVSPPRTGDAWRSTLTIAATIDRRSRIGWPVDGVVVGAAGAPGLAVAVDIHAAEPLRHRTRLTLRGHALPLDALGLRNNRIRLVAPWRLRALVEHWLLREANPRHWTSLDEVALVDLSLPEATPTAYEFLARYRMELIDSVEKAAPFMRHPGLSATAFAHAGLTYAAAQSVGLSGLVAVGAGVTVFDVEPTPGASHERVLAMPWITALADAVAGAPVSFAQAGAATRRWLVSDNDLPPLPIPVAGSDRAWALAVGDASHARLSRALDDAFASAGAAAPATQALRPREQSLLRAEDGQPVEAAAQPRWPRTLLTLKALLNEPPPRRTLAVVPSGRSDGRALRLLITVPRKDAAPPAAAELPPADLIVLGRSGLARVDLDGDVASRADDLSGLRQRAWQALATPRLALFAIRDLANSPLPPRNVDSASAALPARAMSWTTYWHEPAWSAIGALPPYRGPATASPLRRRNDTLHASAALGWPTARNTAELAASSLVRGGDSVLQSPRGFALRLGDRRLPGVAPARDSTAGARFLSLSHHVLFERPPLTLTAPPASHLQPLSPRARMPMASELVAALPTAAECAPLMPGALQHGVIGARAGAMYLSREALLVPLRNDANETAAFDAQHARFGRPAGYAPAVLHQGRAPRSPGLPRDRLYDDANTIVAARDARRRTFVAWSLRTGAPEHGEIATCLIAEGGAALLRDKAQNAAWLLRVAATPGGTITPANATKLVLSVRALTPVDAAVDDPCQTLKQRGRVSLVIDGWTLPLELSAGVDDGSGGKLFRCSVATAQQESVIQRLRAASADARIELQVRIAPDANPENPQSLLRHGDIARLPLPLRPDDRPTPPLQVVSLLFADPAYDRELTSAARQESVVIGQKLLRLSLDRTGYAAGDTVYLAFGLIDNASGTFSSDALPGSQISVHILRDGKIEPVTLTAAKPAISPDGARFEATANTPYCIRLDDVLLVRGEPDKPSFEPAQLRAGDQLIVRLYGPQGLILSAQMPIVAEPTLAPPAAVYGLITRHGGADGEYATVPLFATAPLPSVVELPHLLDDLALGAVRRRGLFSWTFVAETPLLPGTACAALVKLDRTGGGQFPEILDTDFVGLQPPVALA